VRVHLPAELRSREAAAGLEEERVREPVADGEATARRRVREAPEHADVDLDRVAVEVVLRVGLDHGVVEVEVRGGDVGENPRGVRGAAVTVADVHDLGGDVAALGEAQPHGEAVRSEEVPERGAGAEPRDGRVLQLPQRRRRHGINREQPRGVPRIGRRAAGAVLCCLVSFSVGLDLRVTLLHYKQVTLLYVFLNYYRNKRST